MSKSSEFKFDEINAHCQLDTCFRIINVYRIQDDSIISRIDLKIENRQYSVGFASTTPIKPRPGDRITPLDDLITPSGGIIECLNIKASKQELIKCFEEILNDIKTDNIK